MDNYEISDIAFYPKELDDILKNFSMKERWDLYIKLGDYENVQFLVSWSMGVLTGITISFIVLSSQ